MSDIYDSISEPRSKFTSAWLGGNRDSHSIPGAATVFHLEGDEFGIMHEVVELTLCGHGIEGTSSAPVIPGAQVSLGFEAPGHPARRGEIIGCVRCEEGWKIGIAFDERAAA
jgi:hypothetical protein